MPEPAESINPAKPIRSATPAWLTLWLLFIAPGRLMRFALPFSTREAAGRLRAEGALIRPMQTGARVSYAVVLRLPEARTERRFNGWLEPDGLNADRSWLTGQTRTPIRAAVMRLGLSAALFALAFFFLGSDRLWWGSLFLVGTSMFLLLAQYERITGHDRRLYTAWLRSAIGAIPANRPF